MATFVTEPYAKILDMKMNPFMKIERVARLCYKSEDKSTNDMNGACKFVLRLINHGHYAMLEHAVFTFIVPTVLFRKIRAYIPYAHLSEVADRKIVSINLRSLIEFKELCYPMLEVIYEAYFVDAEGEDDVAKMGRYVRNIIDECYQEKVNPNDGDCVLVENIKDLDCLTVQEIFMHSNITVLCHTDRGVSHELVRMRLCSFAQESQRYVNYGKENIEFIVPKDMQPWNVDDAKCRCFKYACEHAEEAYKALIEDGATPQTARSVLPNATATNIFVTANIAEWMHIFDLRLKGITGAPHPDMQKLMKKVWIEFSRVAVDYLDL